VKELGSVRRSILNAVSGRRRNNGFNIATVAVSLLVVGLTSCIQPAAPAPAELRRTPPPWDAPRDAVSYIAAAGMEPQPLSLDTGSQTVQLQIRINGAPVAVPAYVGIDRLRAVQADVHTHDACGELWLEGKAADTVTLGQFFTVWGVHFDRTCVGAACGSVKVVADSAQVGGDPRALRLASVRRIAITATG
jgi:hypothetical protein